MCRRDTEQSASCSFRPCRYQEGNDRRQAARDAHNRKSARIGSAMVDHMDDGLWAASTFRRRSTAIGTNAAQTDVILNLNSIENCSGTKQRLDYCSWFVSLSVPGWPVDMHRDARRKQQSSLPNESMLEGLCGWVGVYIMNLRPSFWKDTWCQGQSTGCIFCPFPAMSRKTTSWDDGLADL